MNRLAAYISQQPEIVSLCWQMAQSCFTPVAERVPRSLALVGSGSSLNVLLCCEPAFRAQLDHVRLFNPLDFIDTVQSGRVTFDQVVVLSQSGASQTSIDAADASIAAGLHTLVLTADPNSPIAQTRAEIIVMPIGIESVGPKTMGYTGSLAMLLGLARALGFPIDCRPQDLAQAVAKILLASREPVANLAQSLAVTNHLVFAARGAHLGTATEAALKLAEIVGLPTAAFPLEELLHGRLHMLRQNSACFIFADTEADLAIAAQTIGVLRGLSLTGWVVNLTGQATPHDLLSNGHEVTLEGNSPLTDRDLPKAFGTLTAILPFQLLANDLALAKGLDPAAMTYPDMSRRLNLKRQKTA